MPRLIALASLLISVSLVAQQRSPLPASQLRHFDDLIERAAAPGKIPAVSAAIAQKGRIVYARAAGFADLEHRTPATTDTRFRTASIAKPMTAVAVLQMMEAGKLDLDAPIRTYVPAWPEKHAPATARQLLAHIGGVRHYKRAGESRGTAGFRKLEDTLRLFKDDALVGPPGAQYRYTTYGYTLLGLAVERCSGREFEAYVRDRVWKPAGMKASVQDHQDVLIPGRASGYRRVGASERRRMSAAKRALLGEGEIVNAHLHDTSMKVPGGGFLSTPTDLCRFAMGLMEGKLLKPETCTLMWKAQRTNDGKRLGYGLGFSVRTRENRREIAHGGGQAGAACYLLFHPQTNSAVAVMTNLTGAPAKEIARSLMALLYQPQ